MGLDIDVYGDLKHVATLMEGEDFYESKLYSDDLFALEDYRFGAKYWCRTDGMTLIKGGVYSYGYSHSFQAGSYSSYNRWRDLLSAMMIGVPARIVWADKDNYKDKPFFNLVYFSDCEGMIGGIAATKLHEDFVAHQAVVSAFPDTLENERFVRVYAEFRKAFEMAIKNGLVVFT